MSIEHVKNVGAITVSVDVEEARVRLDLGDRTIDLPVYRGGELAGALHTAVVRYERHEHEREHAQRLASMRAAGAVEIDGSLYLLRPGRMAWDVVRIDRASRLPDIPASWPTTLLFRVAGGRVLHGWRGRNARGSHRSICGVAWVHQSCERAEPDDARPRCRGCFPAAQ